MNRTLVTALCAFFCISVALEKGALAEDKSGTPVEVRWFKPNSKHPHGFGYIKMPTNWTNNCGSVTSFAQIVGDDQGSADILVRLATSALLSGREITVRTNGCSDGYPTVFAVHLK